MEPMQQDPGAAQADDGWSIEKDAVMLLRVRDQLKQQLMEYTTAVCAGQENTTEYVAEEEFYKSNIQDLEESIEESKGSFQHKSLALQRMQLTLALRNKLNQNDDDSRLIIETMKQIATLSEAIIDHQQQIREKEEKLNDIKKTRLSLKKDQGHKVLQIHNTMKRRKEEEAKKEKEKLDTIHKKLQEEREAITVIQNVFQNIILGSRVNWEKDPSLKAIVLQLEKNVLSEQ